MPYRDGFKYQTTTLAPSFSNRAGAPSPALAASRLRAQRLKALALRLLDARDGVRDPVTISAQGLSACGKNHPLKSPDVTDCHHDGRVPATYSARARVDPMLALRAE